MIPEWVEPFVGLTYADKGRGPTFDCWGMVRAVYEARTGKTLPDYSGAYDRSVRSHEVTEAFTEGFRSPLYQRVAAPQELDIVVFKLAGKPAHCGVMLTATKFLHIYSGIGSCVENVS